MVLWMQSAFLLALWTAKLTTASCPPGWIPSVLGNRKCYMVGDQPTDWASADLACKGKMNGAGNLVSILTGFENGFLNSITGHHYPQCAFNYNIGLMRFHHNFTQWTDGQNVVYQNWAQGQPAMSGNCAAMREGSWYSVACPNYSCYICEYNIPPLSTTTTATTTATTTTTVTTNTDCLDWYHAGYTTSGIYTIHPPNYPNGAFQVFCDMTNGGGWTVIQRRIDGSLTFWNRLWLAYKRGFNNGLNYNLWLGNDKVNALTIKDHNVTLRTELHGDRCQAGCDADGTSPHLHNGFWFDERSFFVDNESAKYRLRITRATAGNASIGSKDYFYAYNNGRMFVTLDQDNNAGGNANCSERGHRGAWWHGRGCSAVCPNGQYGLTGAYGLWWWVHPGGYMINPMRIEMKIRRIV